MSFFSTPQYFSLPSIHQKNSSGSLTLTGSLEQEIYKYRYNAFRTLYTDTKENVVHMDQNENELQIVSGFRYLSSFRDIGQSYKFTGAGYSMYQEGIGEVFIDTLSSPGKVFIMALNTPVRVVLESSDAQEQYTDILLTPHMYLEFQPARGKFLKNADAIRIDTIYKIGYIGGRISESESDPIFSKYFSEEKNFLTSSLGDIYTQDIKSQKMLEDMIQKEVGKIPGYDTIQRYLHLFVNEEKQKIFYKNLILENILELYQENEYSPQKVSIIREDLEALKSIDIASYDEVFSLLRYLQALTFSSYGTEHIVSQIYLGVLGSSVDFEDSWYFSLNGFNLFTLYDSGENFAYDTFTNYLDAFSIFVSEKSDLPEMSTLRYQYFSHSLERQIYFLLDSVGVEQIPFINNILDVYIRSSALSYSDGVTQKLTAVYVYNELLKRLDSFLRNEGFLTERSAEEVLLLNTENDIGAQNIQKLKKHVENILDIYEENKKFFNQGDLRYQTIQQEIEISKNHLDEYFLALENYESYENKYNVLKQSLSNINTFGFSDEIQLSKQEALKYISQFVGLSVNEARVEIIDEIYYSISNVYIAGKNFSFHLHPYDEYKLENIFIDNEKQNFVYKLGRIEQTWEERFQTATKEEKDKYDFSRFFLTSFFSNTDPLIEIYSVEDTRFNEDKTEVVFKRDTLLGEKGEFSTIKDILSIEYDDIRLQQNNEQYDIFITDADIYFEVDMDNEMKKFLAELDSEYVFNENDHYFNQLKIRVLDERKSMNQEKVYLFGGNDIQMIGQLHIKDFRENITQLLIGSSIYDSIHTSILRSYGSVEILMQYTLRNNKMSFKFDSNNKTYTILQSGESVDAIYRGTEKLNQNPIPLNEISSYLQ